jgi:aromatic-L-amino-acid decarboxylase
MMDLQDFRRWGHKAADWCADYLASVREQPVRAQVAPGEVFRQLPVEPPAGGEPMEAIFADLDRIVIH